MNAHAVETVSQIINDEAPLLVGTRELQALAAPASVPFVAAPSAATFAFLVVGRRLRPVPARIDHSLNVALLAARVARRIKGARTGVTEAGAWLHDWGRADSDGIDHCHLGALRVARSGYHPALEHIVASHIGGGLTRAEARRLGLPEGDYLPRTLEALIVAGCDNLFQGSKRQTVTDCANRLDDIGLNQGAARVRRVHARLSRLAGVELDEL